MIIGKITVIDAPCGAGKTSWAIQEMNRHKERSYIFCTPFLKEIDRIRKECGEYRFQEPQPYSGTKISDFNRLLEEGCDIAVTHATFLNSTSETMALFRERNYTLILDESLDVVVEFNKMQTVDDFPRQKVKTKDLEFLLDENIIRIHPDYRVEWCSNEYRGDSKNAELERLAKMGVLYCVDKKFLVAVFPPDIFQMFNQVYVMTYLFDGNLLKYYFQLFGLDYDVASVSLCDGTYALTEYRADADSAFRHRFREQVTICDNPRMNNRDGKALSKSWFERATPQDLKQLKNDIGNYFNRYLKDAKASRGDIMWTCPKDYETKLQGQGYVRKRGLSQKERELPEKKRKEAEAELKCFVPCNAKATNIYGNRWALAYCFNMNIHPMIRRFFTDHNNERQQQGKSEVWPDEKMYSLSCLLQWICRSRIRNGEPISIYLPSKRMRVLLLEWMNVA